MSCDLASTPMRHPQVGSWSSTNLPEEDESVKATEGLDEDRGVTYTTQHLLGITI